MRYVLQVVLSNAQHPEYGQATIPFPIPNQNYDSTIAGHFKIALHHGDNTFFIVHQQYLFHEWASFPRVLKSISYKSQDFLKSLYSTPKILAILS